MTAQGSDLVSKMRTAIANQPQDRARQPSAAGAKTTKLTNSKKYQAACLKVSGPEFSLSDLSKSAIFS
jgi:hypothetical protein